MALTNAAVREMRPGETIYDDVVTGLHVRCTGPRRSFYLYYRTKDGQERRPKLDDWGNISLAQARDAAREMRAQIAAGRDPMAERAKAKADPTVQEFFERAYRDHWLKRRTHREVRRLFDSLVAPRLGSARVQAVGYEDVRRIHAALSDTPYQANRVLAVISRLFNLAVKYQLRVPGDNPCRGVERFTELKRRRYATADELARIGPLLEREAESSPAAVAFIYLLAYSGARPIEIAKARWENLTRVGDAAVLEISDGKTGQITVILPPQAVAVLERLPRVDGRTVTGIKSPKKLWNKVRREAGCPDLRIRDWRRTFATISLSGGASAGVVGELLNHRSAQTTKIYAKLVPQAAHTAAEGAAASVAALLGRPK